MFSFSLFVENSISPGILDQACSLSIFHQAYLTKMTKHVLFQPLFAKRHFTRHTAHLTKFDRARSLSAYLAKRHFTRHTWQSMFSFSLFLQNGTSPGILDKDDKTRSLLACFWKTAFPQAYLTKHVPFLYITWQTWQNMFSFSFFLQNGISPGIRVKVWQRHTWQNTFSFSLSSKTAFHQAYDRECSLSAWLCKTAFHQAYLTKHVLFQLILQNGISPGLLDKHVFFQHVFANWHSIRYTWQSMFSFSLFLQKKDFTRHTWQRRQSMSSCGLFLENVISPGILDNACSPSAKRYFTRHTWQNTKRSGKGLGMLKMKHEKGVGCFMVHKSEVGRAWECPKWFRKVLWGPLPTPPLRTMRNTQTSFHASFLAFPNPSHPTLGSHEAPKPFSSFIFTVPSHPNLGNHEAWSIKKGLGASWFPRVGWEGFGKVKNEAWKGGWVFLMVPKNSFCESLFVLCREYQVVKH